MSDFEPTQPALPAPEPEASLAPPIAEDSFAPAVSVPAPHTAMRGLGIAIVAAIVLATGGGIGIGWNLARAISSHGSTQGSIQTVSPAPNNASSDPASAAARVTPAVVDINSTIQTASATEQAAGTGLILDSHGDIL